MKSFLDGAVGILRMRDRIVQLSAVERGDLDPRGGGSRSDVDRIAVTPNYTESHRRCRGSSNARLIK